MNPPCEVCGKPSILVCCSALGPISHAYCSECSQAYREPWATLVGCVFGVGGVENLGEWVRPIVDATLTFYGKTLADLQAEVDAFDEELARLVDQRSDIE